MDNAITAPVPPSARETGARDAFISAMRRAVSTVCVVTTDGPFGRFGVTVSAMVSVTADPPAVLICINKTNFVIPAIMGNGCFSLNFLRHDQKDIAEVFAGRTPSPETDRFSCAAWSTLVTGSPILEGSVASFDCKLAERVVFGSHTLFIGSVVNVRAGEDQPLIYHDRNYVKLAS